MSILKHDLGVTYGTCPACLTHGVVIDVNQNICGDCVYKAGL